MVPSFQNTTWLLHTTGATSGEEATHAVKKPNGAIAAHDNPGEPIPPEGSYAGDQLHGARSRLLQESVGEPTCLLLDSSGTARELSMLPNGGAVKLGILTTLCSCGRHIRKFRGATRASGRQTGTQGTTAFSSYTDARAWG